MGRSRNKRERLGAVAAAIGLCLWLGACGRSDDGGASDLAALQPTPAAAQGATLARVKARRRLRCGVSDDKPGFSQRNLTGQWRGFDVDMCRAVAAAVLGDSRAVTLVALTSRTRFAALQSGAVDLVSGGGAWTFSHDEALGLNFVGVSYYDGQGFMARGASRLHTIGDLAGARICVLGGAASQQGLADMFKARDEDYQAVVKDTLDEAVQAYRRGECDVLSDDVSVLAGLRDRVNTADQAILPGFIADEPLGLMVREDDSRWADIVRWTLNALVLAEDLGVTSANAEGLRRDTANPLIRRLLGAEGEYGQRMGLAADWSYRAIRQVGDYGEIYQRNLAGLNLPRGRNALWDAADPGQLYAPPMR
ncbi:MAG TPA: amino acid ABC transporter substrate-binding protein [Caulobacteraceae bacterium]|nr:amino acid ABC transporter substrate-binding protein [Caulobacteraceae bacterium]